MSCPITKQIYGPIPDELTDKSLTFYPNHNMITHLGCVLLRVVLGIFVIQAATTEVKNILICILVLAITVFGWKCMSLYQSDTTLWKFYPRMIVSYSTAVYLMLKNRQDLAGIMVILDSIIAFQSRHTTSAVTCGLAKDKKNESTTKVTKSVRFVV